MEKATWSAVLGLTCVLSLPGEAFAGDAGVPVRLEGPVSATTGEIMDAQARFIGPPAPRDFEEKVEQPDRRGLPSNPDSPDVASWPPHVAVTARPGTSVPFAAQTVGLQFTGATLADTFSFPPDTMGAVGPSQFVVFVNGRLRSFNKTTGVADGVLNADPDNFFASVRSSGTSDPRIRYDRLTKRWFLVIIDVSFPNRILLAVSDAASQGVITGATVWSFFFVANGYDPDAAGPNSCLLDYPTLGVDANALYIGGNQFCGPSLNSPATTYASSSGFVVRKSSLLSGGPGVATAFHDLLDGSFNGPYTPQGVDNYDAAATEGYFIGIDGANFGKLQLRRVSDPAGTPTISANVSLTVSTWSAPLRVPHLGNTGGSSGQLDGVDDRLFAAHVRNGRLWTAHAIGVNSSGTSTTPTRDAARWYELTGIPTAQTPSVVQSGTIFDPAATNPSFFTFPSVMVSGQGHAAMGFTAAGAAIRAGAAASGRLATDTLGTADTPAIYMAGAAAYNPPGDNGGGFARRWGDYSYTSLDPNDDMTMWTIQEFTASTNNYGVRVAKLLAPPPATPASSAPDAICTGIADTTVIVTGTSIAGSGFFEPGVSFPNHLAAGIDGGVSVLSVTVDSPTQVTLHVSTVGATPGTRTVTITNPDGQARAAGILIVATAPSAPVVSAPAVAGTGSPNRKASAPVHAGSTYAWTITNGTITSATNLPAITFTAGTSGTTTVTVVETAAGSCGTAEGHADVAIQPFGAATLFYPVTPCRILDTRNAAGALGGPVLAAGPGADRTFPLTSTCGLPATAKVLSTNVTITQPVAGGELRAFAATLGAPVTTVISFKPGATRANNALIGLPADSSGNVVIRNESAGTTHVIVDVNGYWE